MTEIDILLNFRGVLLARAGTFQNFVLSIFFFVKVSRRSKSFVQKKKAPLSMMCYVITYIDNRINY